MDVEDVIRECGNNCIYNILDKYNITISYKEFRAKSTESQIFINDNYEATIFIQENIESEEYKQFLIAHEIGHYVLHFDKNVSFSFMRHIYKTKLEREANDFAVKLLLSDINIKEDNLEFIAREKGIPEKIWFSFLENNYKK